MLFRLETGVREKNHLALVLSGPRTSQTFPWPAPDEADYLELKGLVEHFTQTFHLLGQEYALIDEHPYLLPAVNWKIDGEVVEPFKQRWDGKRCCLNLDTAVFKTGNTQQVFNNRLHRMSFADQHRKRVLQPIWIVFSPTAKHIRMA